MGTRVDVKFGPTFHTHKGDFLYLEWPDGRLERDGKRITRAEANRIKDAACRGEDMSATKGMRSSF